MTPHLIITNLMKSRWCAHSSTSLTVLFVISLPYRSRCPSHKYHMLPFWLKVINYTGLEMDVAALVVSKAAVAAQEAGAKGFALGNAVRKVVRHVTISA